MSHHECGNQRTNPYPKQAVPFIAFLICLVLAACTAQPPSPPPTVIPPTTAPQAAAPTAPTSASAAPVLVLAPEVPAGNIIRLNKAAFPDNLDPQQIGGIPEFAHVGLIYQGLVALDTDLKPVGGAAESWQVSNDGKVYTFKLRPGLKYSDGQPLTAKNFEYALKRAASPEVAGQYQSSTFDIQGAAEYGGADVKTLSKAELQTLRDTVAVKALNDLMLEIRLTHPAPYFPYILTLALGSPVREDMVAKGEDWHLKAENQIGNGPFILQTLSESEKKAVFVPSPTWHGPKPGVDQIVYRYIADTYVAFQAFINGELDMITLAATDLKTVKTNAVLSQRVLTTPGTCSLGFGFNMTKPPFDKRDVRLAFAKAFDREAYARDILQGLARPSLSWLAEGIPGYNPDVGAIQKFDPVAARELLVKAGYPNGQGLPEIKLPYPATPRDKTTAEFIASQYRQHLGVELVLEPLETQMFWSLVKDVKTHPAIIAGTGWCSDYPDPQNWLSTYWRSTALAKNYGYKNEELDKLMDAADVEPDPAKRIALYQRAEKIILEQDVMFVPTDAGVNYLLVKPYVIYGKITSHDVGFPGWFEPWKLGVKR